MHYCASIGITAAQHQAIHAIYDAIYLFTMCSIVGSDAIAGQPCHD
jgi:hypothetical protein